MAERLRRGWLLLIGPMLMIASSVQAAEADVSPRPWTTRREARTVLDKVARWGCQYQAIEPDAVAASPLDLIVLDPVWDGVTGRPASRQEVQRLQTKPDGRPRLVIAYLSVGAAEEYRRYWRSEWGTAAPEWLGPANPDWPRSHSVRYWQDDWQQILADGLSQIIEAGLDGVFLDRVDAYHDWSETRSTALADMAGLVAKLATAARQKAPGFLIIGQNAEQLLPNVMYRNAIDAVSKESLMSGLTGAGRRNTPDQIDWSLHYLKPAQRAGLKIFTIEYLDSPADIAIAREFHSEHGFALFPGTRMLDRLPETRGS